MTDKYGKPMFFNYVDVFDEDGDIFDTYSSARVQYGCKATPHGVKEGFYVDDDFYPRSYNFKAE